MGEERGFVIQTKLCFDVIHVIGTCECECTISLAISLATRSVLYLPTDIHSFI
jgi:hypothetical protein